MPPPSPTRWHFRLANAHVDVFSPTRNRTFSAEACLSVQITLQPSLKTAICPPVRARACAQRSGPSHSVLHWVSGTLQSSVSFRVGLPVPFDTPAPATRDFKRCRSSRTISSAVVVRLDLPIVPGCIVCRVTLPARQIFRGLQHATIGQKPAVRTATLLQAVKAKHPHF